MSWNFALNRQLTFAAARDRPVRRSIGPFSSRSLPTSSRFVHIMGGTQIGWSWARGTSIERDLMEYDVAEHDRIERNLVAVEGGDLLAYHS